jgi:DNA-binding XRE family transcriptional regulator
MHEYGFCRRACAALGDARVSPLQSQKSILAQLEVAGSMCMKAVVMIMKYVFNNIKTRQAAAVPDEIAMQFRDFGARLARLRIARHMRQEEAAIRAGFSRSTAVAIEKGAPSVAIGQVFRYLAACRT